MKYIVILFAITMVYALFNTHSHILQGTAIVAMFAALWNCPSLTKKLPMFSGA